MLKFKLFFQSALVPAVLIGDSDEVISLLYQKEDPNQQDPDKRSPLHAAAFKGDRRIAEALIVNGARVNAKDNKWLTPLHRACCVNSEVRVFCCYHYFQF